MKKNLLAKFAPALALVATLIPVAAFAATYDYVNTSGTLQTVSAPNAEVAIATAPNIAPDSGVMLDNGSPVTTTVSSGDPIFQYVTTAGMLATIHAANSTIAIQTAPNIAPNSGVMAI